MHVIWKYPITNTVQDIEMPRDAKILSVQYQGDTLCLWAMVNPDNPREIRTFFIVGTGHAMYHKELDMYVGTVQNPPFVWHIFEKNYAG